MEGTSDPSSDKMPALPLHQPLSTPPTEEEKKEIDDAKSRPLKKGDLVRVLERSGPKIRTRNGGLGIVYRVVPISSNETDQRQSSQELFRYDVDWVLGGRLQDTSRSDLIYTTKEIEGLTPDKGGSRSHRKRRPTAVVLEGKEFSTAENDLKKAKNVLPKKSKKASAVAKKKAQPKKKPVKSNASKNVKKDDASSNALNGCIDGDFDTIDRPSAALDMYERHRREFEKSLVRLERVDQFGFFLGKPPPVFDEEYSTDEEHDKQKDDRSKNTTSNTETKDIALGGECNSVVVSPNRRGRNSIYFPSTPPFNWSVIRKRMERGRYVLDRVKIEKEMATNLFPDNKSGQNRPMLYTPLPLNQLKIDSPASRATELATNTSNITHSVGVDWSLFRQDVFSMCDAAISRDPRGKFGGSGTLGHAAMKIKEVMEQIYERAGIRQAAEMTTSDAYNKFSQVLSSAENLEPAMQGAWRKTAFPERRYQRLAKSNVICDGLSPLDQRSAVYELKTSMPDRFVGLAYTYDDMGQSEGWMKSVIGETEATAKRKNKKKKYEVDDEYRAAAALAADDGVVRAQVKTTMNVLLLSITDRVMTTLGVLQMPEVRSANWLDGDDRKLKVSAVEDGNRKAHEGEVHISNVTVTADETSLPPEVAEQPVWGLDCYTRQNVTLCLETQFDMNVAVEFIEKWLLPAINSCPADVAHNMACAARVLEGLPLFGNETHIEENASLQAPANDEGSHIFLSRALAEKIAASGPPWLTAAAHQLRVAAEALGEQAFRIHPKGHGCVVLRREGLRANTLVTHYRGEVYPPWRWGEKLDAIEQTQQRLGLRPNLPDFYNMVLERPRVDPRGYGLLFVDASRKAGLGSSFSHSCDPTCEVKVVAINGQLSLVMTTLREIERGEELTFDYNAVTESVNEYRAAICLCGHIKCRGSFLHFASADCYQEVLRRNLPIAVRFSALVKGCTKKVMSKEDEQVLSNHGFGSAAFGAVAFNHHRAVSVNPVFLSNAHEEPLDSMENIPIWLRTFTADTLRYIEYERRALPIALLCNHFSLKKLDALEDPGDKSSIAGKNKKEQIPNYSKTSAGDKENAAVVTSKIAKLPTTVCKKDAGESHEPVARCHEFFDVLNPGMSVASKRSLQKVNDSDRKPIPGSRPEPVFLHFSKQKRSYFLALLHEQGVTDLTGLALNRAIQKIAGSTWQSLSDEMKHYWKDRVQVEWEANGGREKARLEDERKLRIKERESVNPEIVKTHISNDNQIAVKQLETSQQGNKKRKPSDITSCSSLSIKKPKVELSSNNLFDASGSNISFQAADAEGWSAMEQRVHHLTQTLSRVGRVLDRHRESFFAGSNGTSRSSASAAFLRSRIHSPLSIMHDDDVVNWLWNHPNGIVHSLLGMVADEKWVPSSLTEGLESIMKKYNGIAKYSCEQGCDKLYSSELRVPSSSSEAIEMVSAALLECRVCILTTLDAMEVDVKHLRDGENKRKGRERREAMKLRQLEAKKTSTSETAIIRNKSADDTIFECFRDSFNNDTSINAFVVTSAQHSGTVSAAVSADYTSSGDTSALNTSDLKTPVEVRHLDCQFTAERLSAVLPSEPTSRHLEASMTLATLRTQSKNSKFQSVIATSFDRSFRVSKTVDKISNTSPVNSPSKVAGFDSATCESAAENVLQTLSNQLLISQESPSPTSANYSVNEGPLSPDAAAAYNNVRNEGTTDIMKLSDNVTAQCDNPLMSLSLCRSSSAKKGALARSPLLDGWKYRYKLEAAADLLLFYAHTGTFFRLSPYVKFESTPIEVYARELGNSVPRSIVEVVNVPVLNESRRNRTDTDSTRMMTAIGGVAPFDIQTTSARTNIAIVDEEVASSTDSSIADDSDARSEVANNASLASDINSAPKKGSSKKSIVESSSLCEPDDIVTTVNVKYSGEYVLSLLLQWYTGGIGTKAGLPNLTGCVSLPTIAECFDTKEFAKEVDRKHSTRFKPDRMTDYEAEVQPLLLDWLDDRLKRGNPWPELVSRYFSFNKQAPEHSLLDSFSPMGSPVLDFLVTGDDTNIQLILQALKMRSTRFRGTNETIYNESLSLDNDRLHSTVDEGMPAQAVANWVQCEKPDCLKWRKLPWHADLDLLPEKFYCKDNLWDPNFNSCDAPEDAWDENDAQVKFKNTRNEISPNEFTKGARFDIMREGKEKFCNGVVVDFDFSSNTKRVKFHFPKMLQKFDEWIEIDSPRIAPHQSYTRIGQLDKQPFEGRLKERNENNKDNETRFYKKKEKKKEERRVSDLVEANEKSILKPKKSKTEPTLAKSSVKIKFLKGFCLKKDASDDGLQLEEPSICSLNHHEGFRESKNDLFNKKALSAKSCSVLSPAQRAGVKAVVSSEKTRTEKSNGALDITPSFWAANKIAEKQNGEPTKNKESLADFSISERNHTIEDTPKRGKTLFDVMAVRKKTKKSKKSNDLPLRAALSKKVSAKKINTSVAKKTLIESSPSRAPSTSHMDSSPFPRKQVNGKLSRVSSLNPEFPSSAATQVLSTDGNTCESTQNTENLLKTSQSILSTHHAKKKNALGAFGQDPLALLPLIVEESIRAYQCRASIADEMLPSAINFKKIQQKQDFQRSLSFSSIGSKATSHKQALHTNDAHSDSTE